MTREQLPRRTPGKTLADAQATRTSATRRPTDHGHVDGPRGHDDWHDNHGGGDKPHGHKKDSGLGRTVAVSEYVPAPDKDWPGRVDSLPLHPDRTQPMQPVRYADYAPPDATGHHAHDGERELHPLGERPHDHDADGNIVWLPAQPDPTQPLAARPPTGDDADPLPATSGRTEETTLGAGDAPDTTDVPLGSASVGSGGAAGAGRPTQLERHVASAPGRSIGHVLAGHVTEAVLGTPDDLADEKTHMRFVVETALECGAEDHRHGRLADAARLLDLEAAVLHMVSARGLRS